MSAAIKPFTDFLLALGIDEVPHTRKTYLGHLVAVYNLLKTQGLDEEVCLGGLFHSIYGTERFQSFKLPLDRRAELVSLIGQRAERLAYWNCLMDRSSLDAMLAQNDEPFMLHNRENGEAMSLTMVEFNELCSVHLFDWLEQAPRSRFGWGYRRAAYRQMADRLGDGARRAYATVYAQEPAEMAGS